jgi:hypothetical protein
MVESTASNARLAVWWTETFSVDLEAQYELNAAKQRMAINATAYPNYDCRLGIRDGQRVGNVGREAIGRVIQLPVKSAETIIAATDTVVITHVGAHITRSAATRFLIPEEVAGVEELMIMMNRRAGTTARFASGDADAYLRANQAAGSHFMDEQCQSHILIRRDVATRRTAFHEWLHRHLQRKNGVPTPGEDEIIESFLERHKRRFGLGD